MKSFVKRNLSIGIFAIVFVACVLFFVNGTQLSAVAMDSDSLEPYNFGKDDGESITIDETNINELDNIRYIPNKNYFIANPLHAYNDPKYNPKGACTTVAMQMLLGYHNYYSDNRLIPRIKGGIKLLSEDYRNLSEHPDINPSSTSGYGRSSIGTEDEVFLQIYKRTTLANMPGGQNFEFVCNGVRRFINHFAPEIKDKVSVGWGWSSVISTAQKYIDEGLPIVLGCNRTVNGEKNFHVVVAYGYAWHDGTLGFLVHNGYRHNAVQLWIPQGQIGYYAAMRVNHEHNLRDTGIKNETGYEEFECEECGYKTLGLIFQTNDSGDMIVGSLDYLLGDAVLSTLEIPSRINGKRITTIGENAFENCPNYANVTISNGIEHIGANAFKHNEYSTNLSIPSTVSQIDEYAFAEWNKLFTVSFESATNISEHAFADCANLASVEFKSYDVPNVGNDMLANSNCTIFVPYSAMDEYKTAFAQYADRIESKEIVVSFESEGQDIDSKIVHYGETIALTPPDERIGYTFAGWYDNPDFESEPIVSGGKWECEYGITLYAKWNSDDCKITLDPSEGDLDGERVHFVKYGEAFHINVAVEKEGQVFDGWYDDFGVKQIDENGDSVNEWHIAEDITLYAHWRPKSYRIYIDNEGMLTWLSKDGLSSSKTTVEFGMKIRISDLYDTFAESDAGKKEGHIFQRFHYEFSECEKWESIPDLGPDGAEIELTPIWRPKYNTIYFSLMYDAKNPDPISKNYGEDIELYKPTRTGHVFLGWKKSDGEYVYWVKMPDLNIGKQRDGSIMLSADWQPIRYSVHFIGNGGSGSMTPLADRIYDEEFTLPANAFYRTGYDFMGWTLSSDSITADYGDRAKVTNLTAEHNGVAKLYAVWQAKRYNIIYRNLMSDMYPSCDTYTYGTGLPTMPFIFRSFGGTSYLFTELEGWYTSSSFTTRVTSVSATRTGEITLWAKYELRLVSKNDSATHTVTDGSLDNQPKELLFINMKSIYYDKVKGTTLRNVVVSVSLDLWEVDDGYQIIRLTGGPRTPEQKINHAGNSTGKTATNYKFDLSLTIEECREVEYLVLQFTADGFWDDDWQFKNLKVEVRLTN